MTQTEPSAEESNAETFVLKGWSPLTTRLLTSVKLKDKSCAWDVLDDNFGYTFVDGLWKEIEQAKLVHKLIPARTKGESSILANLLAMSSSEEATLIRGDKSIFLSREYRQKAEFATNHPHMHKLISTITKTILDKMGDAISLDTSMTSVQLAVYPGDGKSGYTRHCDRGQTSCMAEPTGSSQTPGGEAERIITAIYYLTDEDWDPILDGGCLRVFSNSNDGINTTDICPFRDRLVIFRSDGVEHEVLPSMRRPRTAITLWFYGHNLGSQDDVTEPSKVEANQASSAAGGRSSNDASTESAVPPAPLSTKPSPLPIFEDSAETAAGTKASSTSLPSIFVSIASYRDSELCPTLDSLFANARHPDRVFVGAVIQNDPSDEGLTMKYANHAHVRSLELAARHALGPCYARSLAQSLHRGEQFVLQIDSHMRFRQNWDDYLIGLWKQTNHDNGNHNKVVLTAYAVGYELPNKIPHEERGTLLVPWKFDENGMLRQRGRLLKKDATQSQSAIPCRLYAAGFNFGPASMILDVPYDPTLDFLFFGEELSMAVRLYTHGYDLYAPPLSVVYHLWSRAHRPTLQSSPSSVPPEQIEEKKMVSRKVVQQQLLGASKPDVLYGLGTTRTVEDFAASLKVDFQMSIIHQGASEGGLPNERFVNTAEATSLFAEDSFERKIATLDTKTQALIEFFLSGMDLDTNK